MMTLSSDPHHQNSNIMLMDPTIVTTACAATAAVDTETTMNLSAYNHTHQHHTHHHHQQQQQQPKLLSETTSTGIPAFPWKLHDVLEDAERKGFASIVSWTLGGRAFKVHNQKQFETQIMTRYFNQTQYKSFQRQLNIYNFVRINTGEAKGSYTHDLLVRGKPDICRFMVRTKIKRKGSKSISNSSERLNELANQQPPNQHKQTRSLDDINSMMMAGAGIMGAGNGNGVGTTGLQNHVFGMSQQPQALFQPHPFAAQQQQQQQQQPSILNIQQGAFSSSNQSAAALQRSYIPNQIILSDAPNSNSSMLGNYNNNNDCSWNNNVDSGFATNCNFNNSNGSLQPPEAAFRRLSLQMFQDLASELQSNKNSNGNALHQQAFGAPVVVSPSVSSSHNSDFMNTSDNNNSSGSNTDGMDAVAHQQQQGSSYSGGDLDHLFDDDIESIGEPVALDEASPFIHNDGIPSAMAEQLLRNMMMMMQHQNQ